MEDVSQETRLLVMLRSGSWEEKCAAADELAAFSTRQSLAALIDALSDEEWMVRTHAARALGRIGDRSAAPALQSIVLNGEQQQWHTRLEAVKALGAVGDWATVEKVMLSDEDEVIRAETTAFLDESDAFVSLPALKKLANADPDEGVRRAATAAIESLESRTGLG